MLRLNTLACAAATLASIPTPASAGAGDFEAAYVDCDEYAGVGPVQALETIERLVPSDYRVIEPFPGAAIVVAQAGSCQQIVVEGQHFGPGIFAQFGVSVVPPLAEPGQGDFYQLAYATNNLQLAIRLRRLGVNARFTPFMSYEITSDDRLRIIVPRPFQYAFRLEGPITRPDPNAPAQPTTVFNYFAAGRRRFGNVLQQNVVQGIRFGAGPEVELTPFGPIIRKLTGNEPLAFPFFSAPEVFDRADVSVRTDSF